MAAQDLSANIAAGVTSPKSVTVDGTTVTQQSISDQIAADQYLAAKAVNRGTGIRYVRQRPQGNSDLDFNRNCD